MDTSGPPLLIAASYDLSVTIEPTFDGQPQPTVFFKSTKIPIHNSQINRILVLDWHRIAVATSPYLIICDLSSAQGQKPLQGSGHQANITDMALLNGRIFTASEDRSWQIFDAGNARSQKKVPTSAALNALVIVDEHRIVTGNEKGIVELWDIEKPEPLLGEFKASQLPVRSIAGHGTSLAVGCHDGSLVLLRVEENSFTQIARTTAHSDVLLRVLVSPDHAMLVTTGADSIAKLWKFDESLALLQELKCPEQKKWVWDAAFTPDSLYVCTGGTDKYYRTWECATGRRVYQSQMRAKGFTAIALIVPSKEGK
jgi:G protein beta subunit-like protein